MKRKLRMKLNRFLVILMSVLMVVYQMPISVMASEEVITESDAFSDSLSGESEDLSQESGNDVGIGDSSTGDVTTGTDIDGSTTISSDDTVDDDTTEGISSGEGDTDVPMFISEIDEDYSISLFSDGEEEEESNNVISVGTYGELLEALDGDDSGDVQENGTIKFTNNITVTKDDITPVDGYYDGIYCTIDTSFTIDFGGYTFTDDGKCINDYVMYFKNTGTKANTITLQNGTVKATGTDAYSTITVGAGSAAYPTTLTLSNMKVENNTAVNGDDVVKVRAGSVANIQNGTVITSNGASAGVNAGSGSTINIYDAQIIQTNSGTTSGNNVYTAITGLGTVNVYDGAVITSDNYGVYMSTSGNAVVNIIGGTITAPTAIYAITNGGDGESVTVNVKGGTIDGKLGEGNAAGEIIISGGTFTGADNVTEFLDENCTVDENGKVTKATSALNGAGTEENPYEISTLEELKFFRNQVNAGNSTYDASGVYVELTASIDLQNENWTPIGTNGDDATRFSGIFNGNGCTISNLYISQEAGYHAAGFFGAIDGTVENLIIDGASVTSLSSGVATVNGTSAAVGSMPYGGTINNVHVKNATINGNRYVAGIVGYAKGTVTNLVIVKTFSKEQSALDEAVEKMALHKRARMKRNHFSNLCNVGFAMAMNGVYLLGAVFCGYGILHGTMSYGTFVAITQLIGQVQNPLANITGYFPKYYAMLASGERMQEAEGFQIDATEKKSVGVIRGFYEQDFKGFGIENASFTYQDGQMVLHNLNLNIQKGEYVAFTGTSGCGKSTLLKLLMCLYSLDAGERYMLSENDKIMLDSSWRGLYAYVPQGNQLMSGTIREIIMFSDKKAMKNEEKLQWALKIACADEFVSELDQGLETELGERGMGLSEGQMQRIAIARAVFSEHPILMLDEATSSLDEVTERKVLENLRTMTDKTVLIVTHRLAVLDICDKQVEMSGGEVKIGRLR